MLVWINKLTDLSGRVHGIIDPGNLPLVSNLMRDSDFSAVAPGLHMQGRVSRAYTD